MARHQLTMTYTQHLHAAIHTAHQHHIQLPAETLHAIATITYKIEHHQ